MRFRFVVDVEVNRIQGKFATREEIADQIQAALQEADPQSYDCAYDGEYVTADWAVAEESDGKPAPTEKEETGGQ